MSKYKANISTDGENFFWIVIENGLIINRNATREEIVKIHTKARYYNKTNVCDRCREEDNITDKSVLYPGNARREEDKKGKETGRWFCNICKAKDYRDMPGSHNNIKKLMGDRRMKNQDPNHSNAFGDNVQELACVLYGWEDQNKKYDNHKIPIDCYDPKTRLYHQVQGRHYDSIVRCWPFTSFEREQKKDKYENMVCFCISKDGKRVERIYKFPEKVVKDKSCAYIYENPSKGGGGWYDQYRIIDEDELRKADEIWKNKI